jgi:hypothetical protein
MVNCGETGRSSDQESGEGDGNRQRHDHGKRDGMTTVFVRAAGFDRFVNGVFHELVYR